MSIGRSRTETEPVERLIFFSDAVVAIAMTLLALELPVPEGNTVREFWDSIRSNDSRYLAFVLSFVVIALAWSHHHQIYRYAERGDRTLRFINMTWLFMIVLMPFATKLLTDAGDDTQTTHALRWGFYALIQAVTTALLFAMTYVLSRHQLCSEDTPPGFVSEARWETLSVVAAFGLSIPLFFVTNDAWLCWIVIPMLIRRLRRAQVFGRS